ncbi:WbqC family protein, partial [Phenylobacterium sp.]|uniref:WbqC family protein n=1 Tax=Phenylobacterium sp. TaxID=1871053 RepID=UPI0025D33943
MQPAYLPYLGYFHLIAASDVFVFLDDVQFARRSWQQRNRIWGAAGEVMLSVPVQKTDRDAAISEIRLADAEPWREKHLNSIRHAYAKRPHFAEGMAFLEEQFARADTGLADLNCGLIEAAAAKLGLEREFVRASTLGAPGHRSDHLLAICRALGATDYLSPMGSHDYMEDDGVFAAASFPARFQGFVEIPYDQGHTPFVPYMAFLDAVMNLGWA